jgi:hypothetical protein
MNKKNNIELITNIIINIDNIYKNLTNFLIGMNINYIDNYDNNLKGKSCRIYQSMKNWL